MNNKILFILHLPPPVHGSSVVGLQIKESNLINTGFNCRYINLGTSKTIDEIGKRTAVKIFRYISIICKVLINLITRKPDLCYLALTAQGAAFYKDAMVVFLIKLFRVKLVYHFHNKGVSNRQEMFLDNLFYRMVFKNTEVILLSKNLYPDIQKYVPAERVNYCSNGISKLVISNQLTEIKDETETVNILFLSNLIESKGVYILLAACKLLQSKQIRFHCTFVGSTGDVSELSFDSKVHQLGLENCVTYLGKKYGIDKESELLKADIFAFPTYYDCFPLVLLEAMQHSIPVVSTYQGGIPDIVEDGVTGFLILQRNATALSQKLEILITNPQLRNQMGKAGRQKYEREFTLEIFEKKLNGILEEIITKV